MNPRLTLSKAESLSRAYSDGLVIAQRMIDQSRNQDPAYHRELRLILDQVTRKANHYSAAVERLRASASPDNLDSAR